MRRVLRGVAAVLAAALAGSCAVHREPAPAPVAAAGMCRVGPDGGPLVAERGIGGTGAPGTLVADRGIGGTGIVGVITGFGSVCVGGEEVALGGGVTVREDAAGADASVLRAGQLVAVEAGGPGGALSARSVVVRHEVSGPVEFAALGRLRVAGQDVAVTDGTWGGGRLPAVGDWVAVSGLRRRDGVVEATRIDPRAPGPVLVHGTLVLERGRLRIGQLPVAAGPEAAGLAGQEVTVSGFLLGAELQASTLEPDLLAVDPGSYFGGGVTTLLVEGFVSVEGGGVRVGRAFLPAGPGFAGPGGRAVVSFSRVGPAGFQAVSEHGPAFGEPGRVFTPAPGARTGADGFGDRGFGDLRRPGGGGSGGPAGQGGGFDPGNGRRRPLR